MADIALIYNQVKIPIHDRDALRFFYGFVMVTFYTFVQHLTLVE